MNYSKALSGVKWKGLGDVQLGRPNLGQELPVIVYRLMQYTIRDIIAEELGDEKAKEIYCRAGYCSGVLFAQNALDLTGDFDYFIANLQKTMVEQKIGILQIEKADLDTMSLTVTVSEDLDCSGLPVTGTTVCDYDEGFLSGILEVYTGKPFRVKEIDCWATGDRTCRFLANMKDG